MRRCLWQGENVLVCACVRVCVVGVEVAMGWGCGLVEKAAAGE